MKQYDFDERRVWSEGQCDISHTDTIRLLLVGCATVRPATPIEQRQGIDYVARLGGGAYVFVDLKARDRGASRFWCHGEPELALEKWSVLPTPDYPNGKIGWTLSQQSLTDMVLYMFDPADTERCYLVGFQPLRLAFERFEHEWTYLYGDKGRTTKQSSGRWQSASIFVPASIVLDGIRQVSRDFAVRQEALFG